MQDEVEGDLGEWGIQAACTHFRRVGAATHLQDQAFARGKGEVVVEVFVVIDVDLRRQLPIPRRGDEEVDVCRAPLVPAELVEQLLRRTFRQACVPRSKTVRKR